MWTLMLVYCVENIFESASLSDTDVHRYVTIPRLYFQHTVGTKVANARDHVETFSQITFLRVWRSHKSVEDKQ
jgi:hypothetical protein